MHKFEKKVHVNEKNNEHFDPSELTNEDILKNSLIMFSVDLDRKNGKIKLKYQFKNKDAEKAPNEQTIVKNFNKRVSIANSMSIARTSMIRSLRESICPPESNRKLSAFYDKRESFSPEK